MEETDTLYRQLHKLSAIHSGESLDQLLITLWRTRRTGIRSSEKSHIQSLLNLPSIGEVDPVLACLRSIIRKCVHENFTGDDLLKQFPPDLSLDLQSTLVQLLLKYQNQWKEEVSREQHPLPRTNTSYQIKKNVPPSSATSDILTTQLPCQDGHVFCFTSNDVEVSTQRTDVTSSFFDDMPLQPVACSSDDLAMIPRLKSMTWKMENGNSGPSNKVAIITLKLQNSSKSSSEEIEVKFQLSRDALEAMLRSLTNIREQIPSTVGNSSGPLQKKQRQCQ